MFEDDDEVEPTDKFDECYICKNKFKFIECEDCGMGENFEEDDPDNLEDMINNNDY